MGFQIKDWLLDTTVARPVRIIVAMTILFGWCFGIYLVFYSMFTLPVASFVKFLGVATCLFLGYGCLDKLITSNERIPDE